MRKILALGLVAALGLAPIFAGQAMAQRKQAPKPVWGAMVGGLSDIQSLVAALAVFDMERAAKIADGLAARETYISNIAALPEVVRKGHAKVAGEAKKLADFARAGEEDRMAAQIGVVLAACSACHYNVRDAERRKKME